MLKTISNVLITVTALCVFCAVAVRVKALASPAPADQNAFSLTPTGWQEHIHVNDWSEEMPLHDQETIRKTFVLNGSEPSLDVDNVFGSIDVVGTDGNQVQLVVNKTLHAETSKKLDDARKKVTLDITQDNDSLRLYVNGPFRSHDGGIDWDDEGYAVNMDFELQVPRATELTLKTVNGGDVHVRNVNGNFTIRNVNGGIEMQSVAGSGSARTVNGPIKASFRQNPRSNSNFQSVNGAIDLSFPPKLSADFRFTTFNGSIFTDFPMTSLAAEASQEEHDGPRVIFRTKRSTGARVGAGGPEIRIENLNGDIRVLENHE
jgi:hypothetical protein